MVEVDVRAVSGLSGIFIGRSAGEPKPARSFMNNPGYYTVTPEVKGKVVSA